MANPAHLAKLKEGVEAWNQWREQHPEIRLDLSKADLGKADLIKVNLTWADLQEANLDGASLDRGDLVGANLHRASLFEASLRAAHLSDVNLSDANLLRANLRAADLSRGNLSASNLRAANFREACLRHADLRGADLRRATFVESNLEGADLTDCRVYGISAWNVRLEGALQANLVITDEHESPIQVDNLEVAQFIYLLLNNQKIRSVIDTITSKVVLILGRFTEERKPVLDAIREELRQRDYLPLLFDFEKPSSRDLTETVSTLAHMARFVIADITDAKSIPQELQRIVPDLPSVPVQPLLLSSQHEYGMFEHFRRYPWVLEPVLYDDQHTLLMQLNDKVIAPAEAKARAQMAG